MRKVFFVVVFSFIFMGGALAANKSIRPKVTQKAPAQITLYAKPSSDAKVVKQYPVTSAFTPIYKKGDWIKVGDPTNDQVGWINQKQYKKALHDYYQSTVQSQTIIFNSSPKGKDSYQIVAYKNGKKLSDKEAKKLLKSVQKKQAAMNKQFRKTQKQMDRWFRQTNDWFSSPDFFDASMPDTFLLNSKRFFR